MTPDQRARESRRLAVAEKVVAVLRGADKPMRTSDIANAIGLSPHATGASLKELVAMDVVEKNMPPSYLDPIRWSLKPSNDVPPEYIQAASIWQVGYRVARDMGVLA